MLQLLVSLIVGRAQSGRRRESPARADPAGAGRMTTEFGLECLVSERLRELREAAQRSALAKRVTRPRVSARAVVGRWLIRLGTLAVGAAATA